MKQQLFNILPSRLKKLRYADKIAHAIYGTTFYLLISLLSNDLALFLTFALAVGVEIYDKYKGGKADMLDALATIAIPKILFLL
jgi:hypothetical protein